MPKWVFHCFSCKPLFNSFLFFIFSSSALIFLMVLSLFCIQGVCYSACLSFSFIYMEVEELCSPCLFMYGHQSVRRCTPPAVDLCIPHVEAQRIQKIQTTKVRFLNNMKHTLFKTSALVVSAFNLSPSLILLFQWYR